MLSIEGFKKAFNIKDDEIVKINKEDYIVETDLFMECNEDGTIKKEGIFLPYEVDNEINEIKAFACMSSFIERNKDKFGNPLHPRSYIDSYDKKMLVIDIPDKLLDSKYLLSIINVCHSNIYISIAFKHSDGTFQSVSTNNFISLLFANEINDVYTNLYHGKNIVDCRLDDSDENYDDNIFYVYYLNTFLIDNNKKDLVITYMCVERDSNTDEYFKNLNFIELDRYNRIANIRSAGKGEINYE